MCMWWHNTEIEYPQINYVCLCSIHCTQDTALWLASVHNVPSLHHVTHSYLISEPNVMLLTLLGETFRICCCCCLLEAVDGEAMPEGLPNVEIHTLGSEACSAVREVMPAVVWADSLVVLVRNSRRRKKDVSTVPSCIGKINMHAMMLPPVIIIMFKQTYFRITNWNYTERVNC
jgi:hypothetical protein